MSRRSVEVDPSFAGRLKELRQDKALSLRRLGKMVHCSHGYLWDLESGTKRPSIAVALLLDNALDAAGELSSLVADMSADTALPPVECESTAGSLPAGLEFAASWRHGVDVAADLWRGDMRRRVLLRSAGFSAAAFMPPAMRWLMSTLDERPTGDGTKTVGSPDIEMVRRVTSTFRTLDNQFGGGHVRESVVRFLDGDVTELISGRFDAVTGRALLAAVAETTQLAAWASYDAGMHGLAQRYLVQALRFSAGAGDRALGAEILAAMSHQAAYKGSSAEAVDLARAAGRSATEVGIRAIQAESAVLEAQGHAASGDEPACAAALDRAEKLFDKADRSRDPQWIGYFDEAYLAAKFGHCFASLGRGDIAQRFAVRSLDMDGKQYARGRQFNLALLALTHVQTGEPEEASRVGIQAADAAEGLSSARARDYLRDLANRLGRHVGLPPVREFVDRVRSTSTDG
jgi:transcriptional regulator with XRE-family HTH domain/tetratricopeptide (TPR) repeat protein